LIRVGDNLGRFRLDRELGRGSNGVVFEATDSLLKERVAIKLLHPWLSGNPEMRERFKRELVLTRRVNHAGICRLHDIHEDGDTFFITMQYIEGRTLSVVVRDDGILKPRRAVQILRGICIALSAAHKAGVIHRDLKPGNIAVKSDDTVTILDFGIATATDVGRLTRPGQTVGSLRFIPPEVWEGKAATALSDIYALGVIGYACLAGRLPYDQPNGGSMLEVLRTTEPPPLTRFNPEVTPELERVVRKMMAIDPAARFQSVEEVEAALTALPTEGQSSAWATARPAAVDFTSASSSNPALSRPPPGALAKSGEGAATSKGDTVVLRTSDVGQTVVDSANGSLPFASAMLVEATRQGRRPSSSDPPMDAEPSPPTPSTNPALSLPQDADPTTKVTRLPTSSGEAEIAAAPPPRKKQRGPVVLAAAVALALVLMIAAALALRAMRPPVAPLDPPPLPSDPPTLPAAPTTGEPPPLDVPSSTGTEPPSGPGPAGGGPSAPATSGPTTPAATGPATPGVGTPPRDPGDATPGRGDDDPGKPARSYQSELRGVQALKQRRGILDGDVAGLDIQLTLAKSANAKGKTAEALASLDKARAIASETRIDRAFVLAKLKRFNLRYDAAQSEAQRSSLKPLAQEISARFTQGDFTGANERLNRAFAILERR